MNPSEAEGVIKYDLEHAEGSLADSDLAPLRAMSGWREVFTSLGIFGRDPSRYGGAGFGNLSARLGDAEQPAGRRCFLVTASQTSGAGPLTANMLCRVETYDAHRNWLASRGPMRPSSEAMTHGTLYDCCDDIRWIFHAHAPDIWRRATALEIPQTRAEVEYGTPDMAAEVVRLLGTMDDPSRGIISMAGHEDGVIAYGRTADEAGELLVRYCARAAGLRLGS